MRSLDGQTVVVIGGSSGIGSQVARQASALGANLVIAGRHPDKLAKAAADLPGQVRTVAVDAHDEAALHGLFATLDGPNHVVSMIGDSMSGGFLTTTSETMHRVLHSKFITNWLIGQKAATCLREGGSLTYTSGTGGRPHEISATYVANLGIGALVQGLAVELAPAVRVNAVAPTFMGTATAFWRDMSAADLASAESAFRDRVPLKRLATTTDVAAGYLDLITNSCITGQVLAVDGGVMLVN
jgi:NAD(P)-dependent dehydrogenase (short-subunit alcohol dehydrogenase family)